MFGERFQKKSFIATTILKTIKVSKNGFDWHRSTFYYFSEEYIFLKPPIRIPLLLYSFQKQEVYIKYSLINGIMLKYILINYYNLNAINQVNYVITRPNGSIGHRLAIPNSLGSNLRLVLSIINFLLWPLPCFERIQKPLVPRSSGGDD